MFNHYYERIGETYWKYSESENAFIVTAQKNIPIGDPVFFHKLYKRYAKIME